jgi:hypothetical protein
MIRQGCINARSLVSKGALIQDIIIAHQLDTLAVCETWIAADDPDVVKLDAVPPTYSVTHLPRPSSTFRPRGGGLCFIHRNAVVVKQHPLQRTLQCMTFECQLLTLQVGGAKSSNDIIVVTVVYRPPALSSANMEAFIDELLGMVVQFRDVIEADQFVMCGDFNCPGDNSTSIHADLSSLLDTHGLQQSVTTATRRTPTVSNVLDLLISRSMSAVIQNVSVQPSHEVSDHDLVTWTLAMRERPPRQVRQYEFRKLKKVDLKQLKK